MIFGDVHAIEETELSVTVDHAPFEGWWEPFTLGVGPAGTYVSGLSDTQRVRPGCQGARSESSMCERRTCRSRTNQLS